jgi:hypothetical protein
MKLDPRICLKTKFTILYQQKYMHGNHTHTHTPHVNIIYKYYQVFRFTIVSNIYINK